MARDNPSVISVEALNHRFDLANKGRAFWLTHGLDAYSRVLLLPYENGSAYAHAASALKEFAEDSPRRTPEQTALICLSADPAVRETGLQWMMITEEETESLIALYSMYEFTGRLVIASFDLPYGRKLCNLIAAGVSTGEELAKDVLLGALHG